jgi:membrane fusion protein
MSARTGRPGRGWLGLALSDGKQAEQPFFRAQAVEEANSHHGSPVRPTGVASWVLTIFGLGVVAGVVLFLSATDFARKETVEGQVTPDAGAMKLSAPRAGVVKWVQAHEGDSVAAGDSVMTISVDANVDGGRSLAGMLALADNAQAAAIDRDLLAKNELTARQRDDILVRRDSLVSQRQTLTSLADLQRQRVELAKQSLAKVEPLYNRGLMPELQYRNLQDAVLSAEQSQEDIRRQTAQADQTLRQLAVEEGRLSAQSADDNAQAQVSRAQLLSREADSAAQRDVVVTAERAGKVASVQAKAGASVQAGAPLAILLPNGSQLRAELWVPSRAVGFIRRGDKVALMYDAFPYERFGMGRGHVESVSAAPIAPEELPFPPDSLDREGLYVVVVALDRQSIDAYGKSWPLVPGMRLSADVILEHRTLLAWLLDPILALRARQAGER